MKNANLNKRIPHIRMKTALEYIFDAQDLLDVGQIQACRKVLNQAQEIGAEPISLIESAISNLVEGKKKLLAASSGSHKSPSLKSNQPLMTPSGPQSKIYSSLLKKKKLNLGLPTRNLKTPGTTDRPKFCIRKLEESPLLHNDHTFPSFEKQWTSDSICKPIFKKNEKVTNFDCSAKDIDNLEIVAGLETKEGNNTRQSNIFADNTGEQDTTKNTNSQNKEVSSHKNSVMDAFVNSNDLNLNKTDLLTDEKEATKSSIFDREDSACMSTDTISPCSNPSCFIENWRCNSDSGFQETAREHDCKDLGSAERVQNNNADKPVDKLDNDIVAKSNPPLNHDNYGQNQAKQPLMDLKPLCRIPPETASKLPRDDQMSLPTCEKENIKIYEFNTERNIASAAKEDRKTFGSSSLQLKELSDLTMKRKKANEALQRNSHSTMKKSKVIRFKKQLYKVISLLGKGGSSKVYEVENEDGKRFALKCVRLDDQDEVMFDSYINEIKVLHALSGHSNIINLHEWEIKEERLHMLMERGDINLKDYLRLNENMNEDQIRSLWKQMLSAVDNIHKQGIIHTDLKPANFLFVGSTLKLIDFGIAKGLQDDCTSAYRDSLIGTLGYMAPESVTGAIFKANEGGKKNYKIRRATDIWSLGCILYLMAYGKTPFQHLTGKTSQLIAIASGKDISYQEIKNQDLLDSIKGCLIPNPSERYSMDQLLSHPFLVCNSDVQAGSQSSSSPETKKPVNMNKILLSLQESTVDSPNSLSRMQKHLGRNFFSTNTANPVRKAIF